MGNIFSQGATFHTNSKLVHLALNAHFLILLMLFCGIIRQKMSWYVRLAPIGVPIGTNRIKKSTFHSKFWVSMLK